ncbi:MAG: SDR family NAD(P)-dependent oxidoreductase, partial [Proteobacteria bacterium]|nr:SDR family NAD(P)-dependent oxidoreductase [Pseudomonadota bacterium]
MATNSNRNRTALITGGGTRIGRAVAQSLAADGWRIALHYRTSAAAANAAAAAITDGGGRAVAL